MIKSILHSSTLMKYLICYLSGWSQNFQTAHPTTAPLRCRSASIPLSAHLFMRLRCWLKWIAHPVWAKTTTNTTTLRNSRWLERRWLTATDQLSTCRVPHNHQSGSPCWARGIDFLERREASEIIVKQEKAKRGRIKRGITFLNVCLSSASICVRIFFFLFSM